MNLKLVYFAVLAEATGVSGDAISTETTDARKLYAQLQSRYRFGLPVEAMRLAVNGVFVDWDHVMSDGDEIAFIPPVSGG